MIAYFQSKVLIKKYNEYQELMIIIIMITNKQIFIFNSINIYFIFIDYLFIAGNKNNIERQN